MIPNYYYHCMLCGVNSFDPICPRCENDVFCVKCVTGGEERDELHSNKSDDTEL
jgi:hypothetical protein